MQEEEMKKSFYVIAALFIVLSGSTLVFSDATISKTKDGVQTVTITGSTTTSGTTASSTASGYTLIVWNELGMHCISPSFKNMSILPPYNNLMVQEIKKGNPPSLITSGVTIEYSIINNKTVAGKT